MGREIQTEKTKIFYTTQCHVSHAPLRVIHFAVILGEWKYNGEATRQRKFSQFDTDRECDRQENNSTCILQLHDIARQTARQ